MGRLGSGLFISAVATFIGLAAFAGCSASGAEVDDLGPTTPPADSQEPSTPLKPGSSGGSSGGGTSSGGVGGDGGTKSDGGSNKDSGTSDPDPPAPQPGEPCANINEVFEKECGACGRHSAICLANPDGGGGFWSEYGDCSGEVPNGCIPGTTITEECGNCGTRTLVCSKYCSWNNPVCTGEPPNSCAPGTVALVFAGCMESGTYRPMPCKADCTYGPAGECAPPPKTIDVASKVNGLSSTIAILSLDRTIAMISGSSCATSSSVTVSTTTNVAYDYIRVHNPLPKAVTVSMWNSAAPPTNAVVDTTLAAYNGEDEPADRKACLQIYGSSTVALTGDTKFASLTDSRKVTIAAGGTVTVYVGGANASQEGAVMLTVRTETIAP